MSKFEVGNRVGRSEELDEDEWNPNEDLSYRGEVIEVNGNKVFVNWDDDWQKKNPEEIYESELMLESEMDEKLSELEKEYNAWVGPIAEKVKEAAKLLNEASNLADANGKELANMHDAVSPMLGAMRNAGWRTSALWC